MKSFLVSDKHFNIFVYSEFGHNLISRLIIKIAISSIVIGLKILFSTSTFQVVTGQFVIGQFNKPIKFKVIV